MKENFVTGQIAELEAEIRKAKCAGMEIPYLKDEWKEWLSGQGKTANTIQSYISYMRTIDSEIFHFEQGCVDDDTSFVGEFFQKVAEVVALAKRVNSIDPEAVEMNAEEIIQAWEERFKEIQEENKDKLRWSPKNMSDYGSALKNYMTFIREYIKKVSPDEPEEIEAEDEKTSMRPRYPELPYEDEFKTFLADRKMTDGSISSYVSNLKRANYVVFDGLIKDGTGLLSKVDEIMRKSKDAAFKFLSTCMKALRDEAWVSRNGLDILKSKQRDMCSAFSAYQDFLSTKFNFGWLDTYTPDDDLPVLVRKTGKKIFFAEKVRKNFYFRISTQNRVSKNKSLMFPISIIGSIMNVDADNKQWLNDWLDKVYSAINVVTEGDDIKMSVVKRIEIDTRAENRVYVITKSGAYKMMTYGKDFEGKKDMQASVLKGFHIHHIPEMQELLKDNSLTGLAYLTEIIKRTGGINNKECRHKALEQWQAIAPEERAGVIEQVKNDLDKIAGAQRLELIQSDCHKRGR